MKIDERIGVSTHALFDLTIDQAIIDISKSGFNTFEIIPADFQGAGGFPFTWKNPGVWPRTFGKEKREELKHKLSCFSQVTVHAPHIGVDIGSCNPGIREESMKQYIDSIEFAHDIGSKIVTFHHGGIAESIEFGRKAVPYAHKYDLRFGYENGGIESIKELKTIIAQINDEKFGLLLDVGHACEHAPKCIDTFRDKIVEIHASGVYRDIDHFPLEMNEGVDYPLVIRKLKNIGYQGPIIFEICYARTINDIMAYCKTAKKELMCYWNQS